MANPVAGCILDFVVAPDGSGYASGVFWLKAPLNRIRPVAPTSTALPSFKAAASIVPTIAPWSLSLAMLNAIEQGFVVEMAFTTGQFATPALVNADIVSRFTAAQGALTASASATNFIGARYDNTGTVTLLSAPAQISIPTS